MVDYRTDATHANNAVSVPVISSERFSSIPTIEQEPQLWPMEIHTPRLFPGEADLTPYAESYAIARRVLLKMIETRHVPDKKELEAHLFGDPIGVSTGPHTQQ